MTINEAHANLTKVISQAVITFNGRPLTYIELLGLLQSEHILFNAAKEFDEAKKEDKELDPAQPNERIPPETQKRITEMKKNKPAEVK